MFNYLPSPRYFSVQRGLIPPLSGGWGFSMHTLRRKCLQSFEMSSSPQRIALPVSPWGDPEPEGGSQPPLTADPTSRAPLPSTGSIAESIGLSKRRSLLPEQLDQTMSTGIIAKITLEGRLEVIFIPTHWRRVQHQNSTHWSLFWSLSCGQ
jgi:hypothetical protein